MQDTLILASFVRGMITFGLIFVSVVMIGLILLQKNRGSGLSGAFGGVGGHTAFGTKTGDFLTWFTVALVSVFFLLSIAGNFAFEEAPEVRPPETIAPAQPAGSGAATDGSDDADGAAAPTGSSTPAPQPTPIAPPVN